MRPISMINLRNFKRIFLLSVYFLKASILTFIGISIYFTICFSFTHPRRTPLMVKRFIEQKKNNKEIIFIHQWVPIERISPHMYQAVVASEDNHFTKHFGIDFGAIRKAQVYNLKSTKRKRGASTISQQTAKNIFLWPARTYIRKGFEVYFTVLIEAFWSKKRVMEMYLNMIEMGPGIYGVEAAAKHYYHKPASRLTRGEAAMIAISLPNPRKRNPAKPSAYMYRRQQEILSLMSKIGKVEL